MRTRLRRAQELTTRSLIFNLKKSLLNIYGAPALLAVEKIGNIPSLLEFIFCCGMQPINK